MEAKMLKDLKKGQWFTVKPLEEPKESQVFIREDYDRGLKKYMCGKYDDISAYRYFKGDKIVYVDFFF